MGRLRVLAIGLALGACAMGGGGEQADQQAMTSGEEVTGTVTGVDDQTHEITVGDETYAMSQQAGTSMMPQVGDQVTLFYREEGDEKVVTRIGQKQQ
jgi:Cu/Ag efflux protein CusF